VSARAGAAGELPTGPNVVSVLDGPGKLRVEERPVPELGAGDVLVEVAAVGVCGSDVHCYRHGRIGSFVVESPLVLGHEASGRVAAAGLDADPSLVGARVAIEPGVPCRRCRACTSGHYNLCPQVRFLGTPPVDGAFACYLAHDAQFVHRLPDAVSDEAGALLEPLSVGVWACWTGQVRVGDRVLVTGAGPIGLLAARVAVVSGAEVTVSDVDSGRLALAAEMEVAATIDPGQVPDADGFEVLLECSGAPEAAFSGIEEVAALRCVLRDRFGHRSEHPAHRVVADSDPFADRPQREPLLAQPGDLGQGVLGQLGRALRPLLPRDQAGDALAPVGRAPPPQRRLLDPEASRDLTGSRRVGLIELDASQPTAGHVARRPAPCGHPPQEHRSRAILAFCDVHPDGDRSGALRRETERRTFAQRGHPGHLGTPDRRRRIAHMSYRYSMPLQTREDGSTRAITGLRQEVWPPHRHRRRSAAVSRLPSRRHLRSDETLPPCEDLRFDAPVLRHRLCHRRSVRIGPVAPRV